MNQRCRSGLIASFLVFTVIVCISAWMWYAFFYDEGVRLGEQIAHEATALRRSNQSERVFSFHPFFGTRQRYSIEIAPGPQCSPTCDSLTGLAVTVERGRSGFTAYHRKFVAVPVHLQIKEDGAAAKITLRKSGNEVQVVGLR